MSETQPDVVDSKPKICQAFPEKDSDISELLSECKAMLQQKQAVLEKIKDFRG